MIKIKADILKPFVEKCTSNSTITDMRLCFTKKGLEMTHKDEPGVIFIAGILNKSAFAQYEECVISLPVTSAVIETLKSFNDNIINIVHDDHTVRILDENGGIDLVQAETVTSAQEGIPDLSYDNKILVKKSMIDTLMARDKIIKSDNVSIKVCDKELVMEIGKESNKAHTKAISGYDGEVSSIFDLPYFKKLTEKLDPIFDLSLSNEGLPAKIEEKTDKYHIIYFLTPMSENDIRERATERVKTSMEDKKMEEENKSSENTEAKEEVKSTEKTEEAPTEAESTEAVADGASEEAKEEAPAEAPAKPAEAPAESTDDGASKEAESTEATQGAKDLKDVPNDITDEEAKKADAEAPAESTEAPAESEKSE